jgi:predicted membrane protein
MARIIVGTTIVLIGLSALLGFSLFRFIFAVALVFIGASIILGKRAGWRSESESTVKQDKISEVAVFSPFSRKIDSEGFKGGDITLIFSGGELDLSGVKTDKEEINLEAVAIFGGLKIIIPNNWRVNNKGTAVLGGYDINAATVSGEGEKKITLNIKGAAIFGGVEVVNK